MAELTARQDSFISLLIEVSGRARPGDLTGVGEEAAKVLLQAYVTAHPERGLRFDGETVSPMPADMPTEKVPIVGFTPASAPPVQPSDELPAWAMEAAPSAVSYAEAEPEGVAPDFGPQDPAFVPFDGLVTQMPAPLAESDPVPATPEPAPEFVMPQDTAASKTAVSWLQKLRPGSVKE